MYSGSSTNRYQAHNEHSTIHKMKETYWTTKQAVYKKLGKKEDEFIVASDSQLDAKLEVFKAIQISTMQLLRIIEKYQDRLCALSQEENSMGRLLKANSQMDKTRAGKMMAAVGKSQSFSSQQRLALRVPLVRLYQEVETFRYRAISDTLMTLNRMEGARTEYRGALLWMKKVSEELDPDAYKQMEKFRQVQAQVKKVKKKFDNLKLDSMQKIDLLAASRCNMFSHVLATYQSTLLHFWQKTSRTMTAVSESFKGYQYYEFNMLKELTETGKKLSEQSGALQSEQHGGTEDDDESQTNKSSQKHQSLESSGEAMIDFGIEEEQSYEELKRKQDEEFDFSGRTIPTASDSNKDATQTENSKDLLTSDCYDDTDKDNMALLNEILNAPSTGGDDFTREWHSVFGQNQPIVPLPNSEADQNIKNQSLSTANSVIQPTSYLPSDLLDLSQSGLSSQPQGATHSQAPGSSNNPSTGAKTPSKNQKADMSAWFNLFADLDPLSNPDAIGRQGEDIGGAL